MPKKDLNQTAAMIARLTTGQTEEQPAKNPAAVALGRLGGLKGGKARANSLTKAQRKAIAEKAAKARWNKKK